MKNVFLFTTLFLCAALSWSCEDDDDAGFDRDEASTWRLTAVLMDPGDGSGTFRPVNSQREITLLPDGTFTATGNICQISEDAGAPSMGTYNLDQGTISVEDCVTVGATPFGLEVAATTLSIKYLCIEDCVHRYTLQ